MKNASVFSLSDALKFFMYIIIIKGISSIWRQLLLGPVIVLYPDFSRPSSLVFPKF